MTNRNRSRGEHPSTYFIDERSRKEEMTRLALQDHLLTSGMGGVLPEQPDPSRFQQVLDLGCGTGGWLIDLAKTVPASASLVGVDVNERLLTYAQAQAQTHQVEARVQFRHMDVLRPLELPDSQFDLVNERLGASYVRCWDWPVLLSECRRVLRPGGIVRLTEGEIIVESSSPALLQLNHLLVHALHQAGHYFRPESQGVTGDLARLLTQQGFQQVQTHAHVLEYQGNTEPGRLFAENTRHLFQTIVPFLRKWTQVPDDYEALYQRMLDETQDPDFTAHWRLLTVWGTRPEARGKESLLST
jgi:ubiquinone/menaquinone biosynthesis C-methylase UbiE